MIDASSLGPTSVTWLMQEGFSIEQTPRQGFSTAFRIYSSAGRDYQVSISQAQGEDKLILSTGVMIGDIERSRLTQLPYETRAQLIRGVGAVLHARSTLFQIEEDQGVISRITLSKVIYSDGFTKDRLMMTVNELFAAHALVILQLQSYFEEVLLRAEEKQSRDVSRLPPTPPVPRSSYCPNCKAAVNPGFQYCGNCGQPLA